LVLAPTEELPDLIIEVAAKDQKLAEDLLKKLQALVVQSDLRHFIAASHLDDMLEGATGEDVEHAKKQLDALIWVGVSSDEARAVQVMNALRENLVVDAPIVVGWTYKALGLAEAKIRTIRLWERKQMLDRQN
jgi:hypothetical protein